MELLLDIVQKLIYKFIVKLTWPSIFNLMYVSVRPKPISDKDWRREALLSGPIYSGLSSCFEMKDSGKWRSVGSDNRLFISYEAKKKNK